MSEQLLLEPPSTDHILESGIAVNYDELRKAVPDDMRKRPSQYEYRPIAIQEETTDEARIPVHAGRVALGKELRDSLVKRNMRGKAI